jgi:hypothetical protein
MVIFALAACDGREGNPGSAVITVSFRAGRLGAMKLQQ